MLTSVVTFYDNETGPSSTASLLSPPPSTLISNRESGIRNPNNRCIFNHFHFSNRKYSAISCPEARRVRPTFQSNATQPDSNEDTAIKTPNKRRHFNHFQFCNRFLSKSLCLRASVANLCDNGWLKLRLM
jgi:hypothetical protein